MPSRRRLEDLGRSTDEVARGAVLHSPHTLLPLRGPWRCLDPATRAARASANARQSLVTRTVAAKRWGRAVRPHPLQSERAGSGGSTGVRADYRTTKDPRTMSHRHTVTGATGGVRLTAASNGDISRSLTASKSM